MNEIFGISADSLLVILLGLSGLILTVVALTAWRYPLSFRLGIRNLRRHRSQTALIVGGLALSTMIITSALGIGDTIDYSTKVGVYDDLGDIDIRISMDNVAAPSGFSLGGSTAGAPSLDAVETPWFDATEFESVAGLVGGDAVDGAVPIVSQVLPVTNTRSVIVPRRELTSTQSPVSRPSSAASTG